MEQPQRQQLTEGLIQVALIESETLAGRLAEIIAYLKKKEHLAALGTFQGLDQQFRFLGTVLETAARLPRK
jgi:hypothetical protein